jgi:DNA polymerase
VVQLGLGYGMGWKTFQTYCAGGPLGMDPIYLDETEADRIVTSYRDRHPFVRGMWKTLQEALSRIMSKKQEHCVPAEIGPVTLRSREIRLPNGMDLLYPDLTNNENGGYEFGVEGKVKYVYGAKLLENIIQALARVVVADQILALDAEFETVSSTHDEALFLADETQAEVALARGIQVFSTPPSWARDLPLSAEGGYATCYSK